MGSQCDMRNLTDTVSGVIGLGYIGLTPVDVKYLFSPEQVDGRL